MLGWRMERITPRPSSLQAAEAGISQSCPPPSAADLGWTGCARDIVDMSLMS